MLKEGVAAITDGLENKQRAIASHVEHLPNAKTLSSLILFSFLFLPSFSSLISACDSLFLFQAQDFECYLNIWRLSVQTNSKSMDNDGKVEENVDLRNNVRSASDKHFGLLRPFARSYSRGQAIDATGNEKGKYALIRDPEDFQTGIYDKPLPFFGCGIGWFSFLFGFLCPPMWFYATILYFGNHYRKDPRERAGLGASAIAALVCSVALLIIAAILLLKSSSLYFQFPLSER